MKKFSLFLFLFFLANNAEAKIIIFACEPEWGGLAREIVKNKAEVEVATRASQNPYLKIERNSALIKMMINADMVFCSGAGLEDEWLPDLLRRSSNLGIKSGKAVIMAADYADKLKNIDLVPAKNKRSIARVHLNPHNILKVADEFTKRVKIIDPLNAIFYQKSYDDFVTRWNIAIKKWEIEAESLKSFPVVIKNDAWAYLVEWLKLSVIVKVEKENGVEPSKKYVRSLVKVLKKNPAEVIIFADFENRDALFFLSKSTNTRVVFLPFTVGGVSNVHNLFDLFNNTINRLKTDCSKTACETFINSSPLKLDLQYGKPTEKQNY